MKNASGSQQAADQSRGPAKSHGGLSRILRATRYSLAGLRAAYRHEAAFRQELLLAAVLAPIGLWLGDDAVSRALLVGSLLLILIVELLNSAIEAVVDLVSPDTHPLAGTAKDLGSAAVMLTLFLSAAIWSIVLLS